METRKKGKVNVGRRRRK
jgi:hypothetical protein